MSNGLPSNAALQIAARAWCTLETSHLTLRPELAEEFARIIDKYREALVWCSGSIDFGQDGQAKVGWDKKCRPLLDGEVVKP